MSQVPSNSCLFIYVRSFTIKIRHTTVYDITFRIIKYKINIYMYVKYALGTLIVLPPIIIKLTENNIYLD